MAQQMFNQTSSSPTNYTTYNQSLILNADFTINQDLLDMEGPPALTATYLVYLYVKISERLVFVTLACFFLGFVFLVVLHVSLRY
jgi:hypothetical protein